MLFPSGLKEILQGRVLAFAKSYRSVSILNLNPTALAGGRPYSWEHQYSNTPFLGGKKRQGGEGRTWQGATSVSQHSSDRTFISGKRENTVKRFCS